MNRFTKPYRVDPLVVHSGWARTGRLQGIKTVVVHKLIPQPKWDLCTLRQTHYALTHPATQKLYLSGPDSRPGSTMFMCIVLSQLTNQCTFAYDFDPSRVRDFITIQLLSEFNTPRGSLFGCLQIQHRVSEYIELKPLAREWYAKLVMDLETEIAAREQLGE